MKGDNLPTTPGRGRAQRSNSTIAIPSMISEETTTRPMGVQFSQYSTKDFILDLNTCSSERQYGDSGYNHRLRTKWNEAKARCVFNYDLNCVYRLLDGDYNLALQLNIERGNRRRKPMRHQSIVQPFNPHRFNFTKLKPEETLFHVRCTDRPVTEDPLDTHLICVNASPMERAHSLVLPSASQCKPQVLTKTAVRLATDLMLLVENEQLRVLYNSLLGHASVNHLHLHMILWPYETDLVYRRFEALTLDSYVIRRPDWFTHVIAYQLTSLDSIDTFINNIHNTVQLLIDRRVAHNFFFTRAPPIRTSGGLRDEETTDKPALVTAYIFPRRSTTGEHPNNFFNPAALELAGCLTVYSYRFFEQATEQSVLRVIEEEARLDDHEFEQLAVSIADALEGRAAWTNSETRNDEEDAATLRAARLSAAHVRRRNTTAALPYLSNLPSNSANTQPTDSLAVDNEAAFENGLSRELIDELRDDFAIVSLPLPTPPAPLRHRSSFSTDGISSTRSSAPSPPLSPSTRRRTQTVDASVGLCRPLYPYH